MGISQYPFGSQGNLRRKRNCLPEIATSAYGLLAMTNLVAGAVGGVHRNLQLPMALTERRYSQTWQRIRSAMPFPFRQCLPEIATAPLGPRNDKPLAFTVLSAACTGRQYRAGSGMPLPYNGRCMHRERPQICGLYTVRRGRRTLQHAIDTSTIPPKNAVSFSGDCIFFIGRIGENARFRRAFSAPAAGAARAGKRRRLRAESA